MTYPFEGQILVSSDDDSYASLDGALTVRREGSEWALRFNGDLIDRCRSRNDIMMRHLVELPETKADGVVERVRDLMASHDAVSVDVVKTMVGADCVVRSYRNGFTSFTFNDGSVATYDANGYFYHKGGQDAVLCR